MHGGSICQLVRSYVATVEDTCMQVYILDQYRYSSIWECLHRDTYILVGTYRVDRLNLNKKMTCQFVIMGDTAKLFHPGKRKTTEYNHVHNNFMLFLSVCLNFLISTKTFCSLA